MAPAGAVGAEYHGTLSSVGRRLIHASVTLGKDADGTIPPAVGTPLVHTRVLPRLDGQPPQRELLRATVTDFEIGNVRHADVTRLEFCCSDFEELELLEPTEIQGGWSASVAFSMATGTSSPMVP